MKMKNADLEELSKEDLIALVVSTKAEVAQHKADSEKFSKEAKQQINARANDKSAYNDAMSALRTQLQGARESAAQEKQAHGVTLVALETTTSECHRIQSTLNTLAVAHQSAMQELDNWRTGAVVAGGVTALGLVLSALSDD